MTERKKGPYWVRRMMADREPGSWEIMHWEGQWFRDHTDARIKDDALFVVSYRIDSPEECIEPGEAGADWDLELACFHGANQAQTTEFYQDLIRRLWKVYCRMEQRADAGPGAALADEFLARELTRDQHGPSYWGSLTDAGRAMYVRRFADAVRRANQERARAGRVGGRLPVRITPEMFDAATQARDAHLRDVDCNDQLGGMGCAIHAALQVKAREGLPIAEGVEVYPLDAFIWKRTSTDEWVLDVSGTINDTSFSIRHPQPGDLSPEDAVGLPSLYTLRDAAEKLADQIHLAVDRDDVVYVPSADLAEDEVRGPTAQVIRGLITTLERAQPRPVVMPKDIIHDGA